MRAAVREKELTMAPDRGLGARSRSWTCFVLAGVLLLFANGGHAIAVAAWLAPVFLLRFVRLQRSAVGLLLAYVLLSVTVGFQLRGMVPIPGLGYVLFLAAYGALLVVPYVAEHFLAPWLPGFTATLVFPTAWAVTEFVTSRGPYGSWGSIAYSQHGDLPLLQLLSVTGLWGVTFLIGWFAAVVNWAWDQPVQSPQVLRRLAVFAAVLVGVFFFGGFRLALFAPSSPTVRVASLTSLAVVKPISGTVRQNVLKGKGSSAEIAEFNNWVATINNDLLARAEREAQSGAKIIFWGEANAPVYKQDEPALIARGRQLAARYHVYLGMALATWDAGQHHPLENKLVLIDSSGQIAWEYFKAHPVPGPEAAMSVTKDGMLRSLDTPHGRVTSVICFDADFPRLLAQAGAMNADIVLDPSNDWRAIDPYHTHMASFRAVEQGVNLIRHTSLGLSAAYDYQGRQLAAMDHYRSTDYVMVSDIPTRGVKTFYSRFGDWFGWTCLAALLVFILRAAGQARRHCTAVSF